VVRVVEQPQPVASALLDLDADSVAYLVGIGDREHRTLLALLNFEQDLCLMGKECATPPRFIPYTGVPWPMN
jgi:hypothetical protein